MTSLAKLPKKYSGGHQIRPRAHRVNPIKALQDREWRIQQIATVTSGRASAGDADGADIGRASRAATPSNRGSPPPPAESAAASSRQQCPNKACKNPKVVDGICRTCGRVADDSNIVAEVTFGENAQGAAVVQGSFLGHDQGGIRPMAGIGHRRVAGNGSAEARERTLREARMSMTGYAHQLNIPEHTITVGFQYYKLASSANFVQGRKIQNVVAVCLYAACRKSTHANPCKIMLIDLADLVKEEVFFLGRTFKKLLQTIEAAARDVQPIYVEDLIFRFAAKLEFDTMTNKVAETAVRLVQRMDRDWMVMGRRPAGICGACLIMAARMYNFRRTVREVVYIAKVTMATLQLRLDEFKELPSAKMTVEEFLAQDFLSEEFDPPSIYKKSTEYQAKIQEKRRSLKRKHSDVFVSVSGSQQRSPSLSDSSSSTPPPSTTTAASAVASTEPAEAEPRIRVVDADGFVVPPLPLKRNRPMAAGEASTGGREKRPRGRDEVDAQDEQRESPADEELELDRQLDALAKEYGDDVGDAGDDAGGPGTTNVLAAGPEDIDLVAVGTDAAALRNRRMGPPDGSSCRTLPVAGGQSRHQEEPDYVDDEWRADEENLEMEMTEAINSAGYLENARAFASAEQHGQLNMLGIGVDAAAGGGGGSGVVAQSSVSDNPEVDEDEFKDDPEVQFCLLSEEEAAAKEKIWMNENRVYLRLRQEKEFRAKMAAVNGTKKQTRRRLKKPKIGEGQTSPASTPGEAAVEAMERRGFSKRINYDAMRRMLDRPAVGRSRAGSASVFSGYTYSRAGSSVGSVAGDDGDGGDDGDDGDEQDAEATYGPSSQHRGEAVRSRLGTAAVEESYDEGGDDGPEYPDEEEEHEIDPFAEDGGQEDEEEEEGGGEEDEEDE